MKLASTQRYRDYCRLQIELCTPIYLPMVRMYTYNLIFLALNLILLRFEYLVERVRQQNLHCCQHKYKELSQLIRF